MGVDRSGLVAMGFTNSAVDAALQQAPQSMEDAVALLLRPALGSRSRRLLIELQGAQKCQAELDRFPLYSHDGSPVNECRERTMQRIRSNIGQAPTNAFPGYQHALSLVRDRPDIAELCRSVQCFTHPGSKDAHSYTRNQILGRFDVLAVPAKMDFDNLWAEGAADNALFLVHHVAALDIGSERPADFDDYSFGRGQFDETRYIWDMRTIFRVALAAQRFSGVEQAVWFPLGMGAFLRLLPQQDALYQFPEAMANLRLLIARAFFEALVEELGNTSNMKVHLCLAQGPEGSEVDENCLAFLKALKEAPPAGCIASLTVWLNTDAAALAQHLANTSRSQPLAVSLTNGANRALIGNHWFGDGAKRAIDENLHRRSESLSLMAFLTNGVKTLNNGQSWESRIRTSEWVKKLGGRHYQVDATCTPLRFFDGSSPSPSRPAM
jgi:hypothetical protein